MNPSRGANAPFSRDRDRRAGAGKVPALRVPGPAPCFAGQGLVEVTVTERAVMRFLWTCPLPFPPMKSQCRFGCTAGWSCGGPAVLDELHCVVEPGFLDDLRERSKSAELNSRNRFTIPRAGIMKTGSDGFQPCRNARTAVYGEHRNHRRDHRVDAAGEPVQLGRPGRRRPAGMPCPRPVGCLPGNPR